MQTLPTRDGYDRWAAIYDDEGNPLCAIEEPRVADLLGDVRDLRVLDVGCGTGRHALRLAAAGARVTAVDFSEGMLAKARAKPGAERVRFVRHDVTAAPLPFEDGAFDRVLSCLVVDHVARLEPFFAELRRVCAPAPAGRIVVTTLHPAMNLRGVRARFRDPVSREKFEVESRDHTTSDYVMALLRAGLVIDAMEEHAPDDELASRCPRAAEYVGWPLLLAFAARR